jgi:hypothetical protein
MLSTCKACAILSGVAALGALDAFQDAPQARGHLDFLPELLVSKSTYKS